MCRCGLEVGAYRGFADDRFNVDHHNIPCSDLASCHLFLQGRTAYIRHSPDPKLRSLGTAVMTERSILTKVWINYYLRLDDILPVSSILVSAALGINAFFFLRRLFRFFFGLLGGVPPWSEPWSLWGPFKLSNGLVRRSRGTDLCRYCIINAGVDVKEASTVRWLWGVRSKSNNSSGFMNNKFEFIDKMQTHLYHVGVSMEDWEHVNYSKEGRKLQL